MPGSPLDPRCEGTNKLIKDGANILTSIDDVLNALSAPHFVNRGMLFEPELKAVAMSTGVKEADRVRVSSLLSLSPIATDDLIRESGLAAEQVVTILLELEIAGRAIRHAGGRISAAS